MLVGICPNRPHMFHRNCNHIAHVHLANKRSKLNVQVIMYMSVRKGTLCNELRCYADFSIKEKKSRSDPSKIVEKSDKMRLTTKITCFRILHCYTCPHKIRFQHIVRGGIIWAEDHYPQAFM